jgi:hypothetical protein
MTGCQTFQTSDFSIFIREPASKKCFELFVMSGKEKEYDEAKCDDMIARSIHLSSNSWRMLRTDVQTNCQFDQCKQITGAGDAAFLALDRALQIPGL